MGPSKSDLGEHICWVFLSVIILLQGELKVLDDAIRMWLVGIYQP